MSKFTPLFIREALSLEQEAVQQYEQSRVGAQATDEESLDAFRERLKARAKTFACEAFVQYVCHKRTLSGIALGRRRRLQPGSDVRQAVSGPLQKLLDSGQSSRQSSLNWKGRSSSIIMDCRPFLYTCAAWGKKGPATCTTEAKIPTSKGELKAVIKVNLDEYAQAVAGSPALVKHLLPVQTPSDSPKPSKRLRKDSESPPPLTQSNFNICIAGKYAGPGTCKVPIVDFVLGQGGPIFNKVGLPDCLRGCWKLKQLQMTAFETKASVEVPDTSVQDVTELQSLVLQERLYARFWGAKFDTDDPAAAVVVWTVDVGQSDDRIKLWLNNRQLNDDEAHQLFAAEYPELLVEEAMPTGVSPPADEPGCQLALLSGTKSNDADTDLAQVLADMHPPLATDAPPELTADRCLSGFDYRSLLNEDGDAQTSGTALVHDDLQPFMQ